MRLVVIGGGGFGREVLDVIEAIGDFFDQPHEVLGVLDDGVPDSRLLEPYKVDHLGPVSTLAELDPDVGYVIGVGDPATRARLDAAWSDRPSPVLVHPSVTMGREVQLGAGSVVCAGAMLTNHITLGRHVHVNLGCTIGHDATLGDHVTLSPLVAISGNVRAGERAFFGTGAKVNPGLTIGGGATVGTGAAVIRDVEAGLTVVGVPAKPRS